MPLREPEIKHERDEDDENDREKQDDRCNTARSGATRVLLLIRCITNARVVGHDDGVCGMKVLTDKQ